MTESGPVSWAERLGRWPLLQQIRTGDLRGLGEVVLSEPNRHPAPRAAGATFVDSVCPYCATGCGCRSPSPTAGSSASTATSGPPCREAGCARRGRATWVPRRSQPSLRDDVGFEGRRVTAGFFTDTSVCLGCKACEVACKEWNQLPDDGFVFTGMS